MGDFNLNLDMWRNAPDDDLLGWELYPTNNRPARDLRSHQIDYALVRASDGIDFRDNGSKMFSPFPVKVTFHGVDRIYSLSTEACAFADRVVANFTTKHLMSKELSNSAPLHSTFSLPFGLIVSELFQTHEKCLADSKLSKLIFDHDFIYLSIYFSSMVCCSEVIICLRLGRSRYNN